MNQDDGFLSESRHNSFKIVEEVLKFAENEILLAIDFLNQYLGTKNYQIIDRKTYDINLISGIFKCGSFKTKFIKDASNHCIVEVSNSFNLKGPRYWTYFRNKGGYWTNQEKLNHVNSELVFNLLAHNHDWIYKNIVIIKDNILAGVYDTDFDLYPETYKELGEIDTSQSKEQVAFEVFKRVFRK